MSDYIADAIASCNLSISNEALGDSRYRCELKSGKSSMVREVQMVEGSGAGPTAGQMLYYFLTRVQAVESTSDFLEWADEVGRNASDSDALEEYRRRVKDADDLKGLVGADTFLNLLQSLAIDQAISNASAGFKH